MQFDHPADVDTDHDGDISVDELDAALMARRAAHIDGNRDGEISVDELDAAMTARRAGRAE
jgi:hypothetical protein